MRIFLALAAIFLFAGTQVAAAGLSPEDFAEGYYLDLQGRGAIYTVELPQDVYKVVTRADLGDVRIFNGAGEVVPHIIKQHRQNREAKASREPVAFFPLFSNGVDAIADISMWVRKNSDGTILEVNSRNQQAEEKSLLKGYLLDLSKIVSPLHSLEFSWLETAGGSLVNIRIESSSDLVHWQTVVATATLANLRFNDQQVLQNVVELPAVHQKYLRINWLQGNTPLELTGVMAQSMAVDDTRELHWLPLSATAVVGRDKRPEIFFSTDYQLPVSAVRMAFPDENSIAALEIYSRLDNQHEWRRKCKKNFFQLMVDDVTLKSDTCSFPPVEEKFWRVVVASSGTGLERTDKTMSMYIGYRPHEVTFIARGNPPYLLAYGSGALTTDSSVNDIDIPGATGTQGAAKNLSRSAVPGKHVILGGSGALAVPPPPLPWKTWVLWFVLISGVILLIFMARALLRDMQSRTG